MPSALTPQERSSTPSDFSLESLVRSMTFLATAFEIDRPLQDEEGLAIVLLDRTVRSYTRGRYPCGYNSIW